MARPPVLEDAGRPAAEAAGRCPPRAPRRSSRSAVVAAGLAWSTIGLLGVVAAVRLVAWDACWPFAAADALTPVLGLVAGVVVIGAVPLRRVGLALAALGVVAVDAGFVVPEIAAARPLPAWSAAAPEVRLLDANVSAANPSMAGYARQLRAVAPGLVALEEATPADVAALEADGALAGLDHRVEVPRFDPWGILVASRYRLGPTRVVSAYGRPLAVETVVHLPSGPFGLWVVHTVAPLPASFGQWRGQLALLARLLAARGTRDLAVVGDLNATWQNAGFQRLLATGLHDAAAARGDPFAMTWSQGLPLVGPLVRIDHVLTGPGVAATAIAVAPGPGSDHAELRVDLAIRPGPGTMARVSRPAGAGAGPAGAG